MLLGKRPRRPSMRRTTSLTEFTLDLSGLEDSSATSDMTTAENTMKDRQKVVVQEGPAARKNQPAGFGGGFGPTDGFDYRLMATVSPRPTHRKNLSDLMETSQFLRACNLCKRRLGPGRDIYMYRGDSAFCSLECRQQQMNKDERKEKCAVASKKDSPNTGGSESSPSKGETVAAA
ncbi:FCS-Like Zinc finger 5-like [Telopea speciosissima]|uniref:FCS-Like Zinc finger 5-like n=1 Tax=Telopea speciosissima TaxID=54955 RepID=UPI001CC3D494|nr:FCS-Like Zinc finger 5-like [Telopea speciosissima]